MAAAKDDEFLHEKQKFRNVLDAHHGDNGQIGREELEDAASGYTTFLKKFFRNRRRFELTYGLCVAVWVPASGYWPDRSAWPLAQGSALVSVLRPRLRITSDLATLS